MVAAMAGSTMAAGANQPPHAQTISVNPWPAVKQVNAPSKERQPHPAASTTSKNSKWSSPVSTWVAPLRTDSASTTVADGSSVCVLRSGKNRSHCVSFCRVMVRSCCRSLAALPNKLKLSESGSGAVCPCALIGTAAGLS